MEKKEIIRIAEEKADIVGLKHKGVIVRERYVDGYHVIGDNLEVRFEDDRLIFDILSPKDMNPEATSRALEHLVCHARCLHDETYDMTTFKLEGEHLGRISDNMFYAYSEYFISQMHIDRFGIEAFKRYINHNLEWLLEQKDQEIASNRDNPKEVAVLISALYREQINCDLAGFENKTPKGLKKIVHPFVGCFEMINQSDMEWYEKSKLLFVMALTHLQKVDIVNNYLNGIFRIRDEVESATRMLYEDSHIDNKTAYYADLIEEYLIREYDNIAKQSNPKISLN